MIFTRNPEILKLERQGIRKICSTKTGVRYFGNYLEDGMTCVTPLFDSVEGLLSHIKASGINLLKPKKVLRDRSWAYVYDYE